MGLMVLGALTVYLLVSIWVTNKAVSWAKSNNKKPWLWGGLAAFVMYNLVFWDLIPTLVMHKYYCATQAGFWVYKTPEQWKQENPGVMEGLVNNKGAPSARQGDMKNYSDTYFLNDRFNWVVKRHGKFLFNRWLHEQSVVDTKTGEVLVKYVDFSTSQISPQAGWNGWKMWLANEHCTNGEYNQGQMYLYEDTVRGVEK
jgi:hypothetical protein